MCTLNDNHMIYGSWDMERDGHNFLSFWTKMKTQNFTKNKQKKPEDIIILHMCTINDNHIMHGSWDQELGGQGFFSFWTVFCPFTHPMDQENQNFENIKIRPGDIIILQICTINDNHIMYGSWYIECNRQNFCCFGLFFALLQQPF